MPFSPHPHPHLGHRVSSDIEFLCGGGAVNQTYSKFDASLSIVSTELCSRLALFYCAQIETVGKLIVQSSPPAVIIGTAISYLKTVIDQIHFHDETALLRKIAHVTMLVSWFSLLYLNYS